MPTELLDSPTRTWTAAELRRMPPHERDAILVAAAALAERDYVDDIALTAFAAFGVETR